MREETTMLDPTAARKPHSVLLGLLALTMTLGAASAALAKDPPFNMSEVSNFDQAGQIYADVWGDGDFAYLAHFAQSRVDIIDLTDPSDPQLAAFVNTQVGSAQDVKVGDGLMFVGLESASPGVKIYDVRNPYDPELLTNVTAMSAVHNVFYHEGWLFVVDSSSDEIDIHDLRDYDPDNPPATISQATWTVDNVGFFVHDVTAVGHLLFAASWDAIRVFDITDLDAGPPVFLTLAPGDSVHSSWATADLKYLVAAEERTGGGLTLYEMVDAETPGALSLVLRDTFEIPVSRATSVHNPVIKDYRVYTAWYQVSVLVLDIDPVLGALALVA